LLDSINLERMGKEKVDGLISRL